MTGPSHLLDGGCRIEGQRRKNDAKYSGTGSEMNGVSSTRAGNAVEAGWAGCREKRC